MKPSETFYIILAIIAHLLNIIICLQNNFEPYSCIKKCEPFISKANNEFYNPILKNINFCFILSKKDIISVASEQPNSIRLTLRKRYKIQFFLCLINEFIKNRKEYEMLIEYSKYPLLTLEDILYGRITELEFNVYNTKKLLKKFLKSKTQYKRLRYVVKIFESLLASKDIMFNKKDKCL